MLNVFSWFKKKSLSEEKTSKFKIEYYPEADKYYPTYKGCYFYLNWATGIYELQDRMSYAKYERTEADAMYHIKQYKEQQFKENVKIIDVP